MGKDDNWEDSKNWDEYETDEDGKRVKKSKHKYYSPYYERNYK